MTISPATNPRITVLLADFGQVADDGLYWSLQVQVDLEVIGRVRTDADAVDTARRLKPDVVVVHVGESVFKGVETCFRIRIYHPEAKVVMVAPRLSPSNLMLALEARVHGYVVADAGYQAVARAVHSVPAGAVYLSGSAADALVASYFERSEPGQQAGGRKQLSKRERQVLQRLVEGESSVNIARELDLSPKTVDTYRRRLMQKLGVTSRPALIRYATSHGLASGSGALPDQRP